MGGAQRRRAPGSAAALWGCAMQPNESVAHPPAVDAGAGDDGFISDAEADAKVVYLAELSNLRYGRERKDAAEALGLTVAWLDKMVRSKKSEIFAQVTGGTEVNGGGQGRPINLPEPEPWLEAVNGAALLS